jgi:hypothetical protein
VVINCFICSLVEETLLIFDVFDLIVHFTFCLVQLFVQDPRLIVRCDICLVQKLDHILVVIELIK